jgi:predicted lipoprotein with Yx(FWY)xxD motif
MSYRWLAAPVLAAVAVVGIAACGSSNSPSPASTSTTNPPASSGTNTGSTSSNTNPSATGIKTATTSVGTVLVDAQGYTLYWFANDTSTASKCSGSCATFWSPVVGTPTLAAGVSLSGPLGTIKRANGQLQATYMGHPLYTYTSDKSAGQVTGNDLTDSFGLWWAMTPSGSTVKASSGGSGSSPSPSSGGGGGGYGY